MTRSLGLPISLALLLTGCDEKLPDTAPPPPITGRANAVAAKPSQTVAQAATASIPTSSPQGPARKLCEGQKPRPSPKGSPKTAAAEGESPPPSSLPIGVGKWTWVNLWAAWCAPCKEEMPRILAWKKKLSEAGVMIDLVFLSLDDDERQMRRFLDGQPKDGVRSTYWLPEGERSGWLGSLNLKESPQLPVQILFAPSGQATCVIEGAVEDRDYPAIASFMGAKR